MPFSVYAEAFEEVVGLQVRTDLFSAAHYIAMPLGRLTLTLPSFDDPRFGHKVVAKEEWTVGQENDPWYGLSKIALRLDLNDPVEVDVEDRERLPIATKQALPELATINNDLRVGFDLWKRMLRWITGSSALGLRDIRFHGSSRQEAVRFYRADDGLQLTGHGGTVSGLPVTKISMAHWQAVQDALDQKRSIPLWMDLYHEARHRLWAGDVNGAVLTCATACETVLRAVFWTHLQSIPSVAIRREVDKVAVQGLLGKWAELSSLPKKIAEGKSTSAVHKLFDRRNDVIHQGEKMDTQLKDVTEIIIAVRDFIDQADQIWHNRLNLSTQHRVLLYS